MTQTSDAQAVDDTVLAEIRRGILERLALRDGGRPVLCRCTPHNDRPKVAYANRDDAEMAARALVHLPDAEPIVLYPCQAHPGQWHHATARQRDGQSPNVVRPPRS